MDILVNVVLPLGLAFIMFSLGLGLTVGDFTRVLRYPRAFGLGVLAQVFLLPAMGFLIIHLFGISGAMAVGVMILCFCPGGVTSNIIAKFARADVALSVSLTAVISLTSMFTVPLFLALVIGYFQASNAPDVNVTSLAISMFLITVLPIAIGVALRHFKPDMAEGAEPMVARVATGLFVLIVLAALASNWGLFVENLPVLAPTLIVLNLSLLAIGLLVSRFAGLGWNMSKTIAVETGIQNSTLGIAVAGLLLPGVAGFSEYALPSAVYGILMYLVSLPIVFVLRGMNDE